MIQLPDFEKFDDQQQYIKDHIGELLEDAIEVFNNTEGYSKPLEDRFRYLRPYAHDVATHSLDEIEKVKPMVKKGCKHSN